ncbi:MAG: nitroreductase/quinone reductase family protein [Actinomycetes bacterium]
MDDADPLLLAQLERVAEHEARVSAGPLTRLTRSLGKTAAFSAVYRRIGPAIDPTIAQWRGGRFMAGLYGFPMLLLSSTGAKSGAHRTSPLLYVRDGNDIIVVGTNFGQPKHPAWTANLRANGAAEVQIGAERLAVRAAEVDTVDWNRFFPAFVSVYPGYANYLQRRGGLTPRMFRLTPVASARSPG